MSAKTLTSVSPTGFDRYRTDRGAPWFKDRPIMPWPARELLEKYSGYAPSEVEKEVVALRDNAWETFPFPCIGAFEFLELALSHRTRLYHRLLSRLQSGEIFLDIGCCLGHDIRKLVFDGAPAKNLVGADLRQGYIDLGYQLFRDRDRLEARFYQANVLDDITVGPWPELVGKFDIVNFSLVLHCFERDGQIAMLERGIQVLKAGKLGTTIIGTACGTEGGVEEDWGEKIPNHNPETFRELMAEVEARTGTKWEIEVELDNCWSVWDPKYFWIGPRMKRLVFEMTRVG